MNKINHKMSKLPTFLEVLISTSNINSLLEVSISNLFLSAQRAFPYTKKRQHRLNNVSIRRLIWTPNEASKTLMVSGPGRDEDGEYACSIEFQGVKYLPSDSSTSTTVEIKPGLGKTYYLEPLSLNTTNVKVRCDCKDFQHRFMYPNQKKRSLYGNPIPYTRKTDTRPSVNPTNAEGICKHLLKLAVEIAKSGIVVETEFLGYK